LGSIARSASARQPPAATAVSGAIASRQAKPPMSAHARRHPLAMRDRRWHIRNLDHVPVSPFADASASAPAPRLPPRCPGMLAEKLEDTVGAALQFER